jgi:hypothetical protein
MNLSYFLICNDSIYWSSVEYILMLRYGIIFGYSSNYILILFAIQRYNFYSIVLISYAN